MNVIGIHSRTLTPRLVFYFLTFTGLVPNFVRRPLLICLLECKIRKCTPKLRVGTRILIFSVSCIIEEQGNDLRDLHRCPPRSFRSLRADESGPDKSSCTTLRPIN